MIITNHAFARAKERLGLGRLCFMRLAEKARERGVYTRWLEFEFQLNVEGFGDDGKNGITRILYQGAGFLIKGGALVTVVKLDAAVMARLSEYLRLLNELIEARKDGFR